MKTQDEVAKSAEMCVISAILINEKALVNVIQTLKPEHFYFEELKAAYQAILELSSEGCVTAQANSRTKSCKERSLNSRDGEPPLGLIVIDYLQLMRSTKRFENRNLEVGAICRELKCLASELGVPILCLSQLNRSSDESTRPSPSELRDSGSIEQDANKVILMRCIEKKLMNEVW